METIELLKAIALDWSSPDWTSYTSSRQGLAHCHYNPHEREELLRIVNMINEASAVEWLVEGGPQTPKSAAEPSNPDTPVMASGDVLMIPVDPYLMRRKKRSSSSSRPLRTSVKLLPLSGARLRLLE
eukprot:2660984-Amphidinium_carterae.1